MSEGRATGVLVNSWSASYSRDGDYLILREEPWWVVPVELLFVPFIRFAWTYRFGNFALLKLDDFRTELHRMPLPDEVADPFWRDIEDDT